MIKWIGRTILAVGILACLYVVVSVAQQDNVVVVTKEVDKPRNPQDERKLAADIFVLAALDYAARDGATIPVENMEKMVTASFFVADLFPDFGPSDFYSRAAKFLSYGYGETRWHFNDISYNRPGYTPHVNHFSVDFWWSGLNEINMYGPNSLRKQALAMQRAGKLPKSLKLMQPPSHISILQAHYDYIYQKEAHVRPSQMMFRVEVQEYTQDDITSALLYRILEERERLHLGLNQQYYKGANDRAEAFILKRLHAAGIN